MTGVFFNGRQLITPQSASFLDDSAMFNPNASVGNAAALIGRAYGVKPLTAHTFGSAKEAVDAINPDDATRKAIERAFDPSAEVSGASRLVYIGVNPATQASLALKDAGNATVIALAASAYSRRGNQVKVKIEAASVAGKKVTTQLGNSYYSQDNIARSAFDVRYAGAAAAVTLSVAGAAVTLSVDATPTVLDLNDYPTVQELVDRINAVAGFTANVLDGNGGKPALQGLDFITNVDCKSATVTVTAHLQAVIDWINGPAEGFVTATRPANVGALPVNIPFTYLTGGTDGVVTNAEWQAAFDALQMVDVQCITALSDLPAIHAMADTHCSFMSNRTKRLRRNFAGAGTGMTIATAKAAAKALNSDRTAYTPGGVYDYDTANNLVLFPAWVAAAALCGAFSGSNPGTAMTNKSFKFRGLEMKLRNPTDTDELIPAGVLCFEDTEEGIKCVQSVSTWLNNDNYNRVEVSTGIAADYTLRAVQEAIDGVRGKKGSPRTLQEAIQRADTRLKELSQPEATGGVGVLVGDAKNPPYRKLTGRLDGDVIRIEYEASVVVPTNYVLQTAHAVPYSGAAAA